MTTEGTKDLRDFEPRLQVSTISVEDDTEHRTSSSVVSEARLRDRQYTEAVDGLRRQLLEEESITVARDNWSEVSWVEQDEPSENHPSIQSKEAEPSGWGDDSWEEHSLNRFEEIQQSIWDGVSPTEPASLGDGASMSGWGPPSDQTDAGAFVDLGYFDREIVILESNWVVRVAYTGNGVEDWIQKYSAQEHLFGVDIEWRPNHFKGEDNKAALLQIAGKHGCLIVQLLYIDRIPEALKALLADPSAKLAGVGVKADGRKLLHDYGLKCRGEVDLGLLAADVLKRRDLKRAGLATLCELVLGIPFKKIKSLTVSNWATEGLSLPQITYAASDACIAYSLLITLNGKLQEGVPARSPRSSLPRT